MKTIEQNLQRIADSLEAIAINLQQEVAADVPTNTSPSSPEPSAQQQPPKAKSKKTAKNKTTSKKTEEIVDKDPFGVNDPEASTCAPTKDDLKLAVRDAVQKKGKDKMMEILNKYGFDPVKKDIDPAKYAECIAELVGK